MRDEERAFYNEAANRNVNKKADTDMDEEARYDRHIASGGLDHRNANRGATQLNSNIDLNTPPVDDEVARMMRHIASGGLNHRNANLGTVQTAPNVAPSFPLADEDDEVMRMARHIASGGLDHRNANQGGAQAAPDVPPNVPPVDDDDEAARLERESQRRRSVAGDVNDEADRLERESQRRRAESNRRNNEPDNLVDDPEAAAMGGSDRNRPDNRQPRNPEGPHPPAFFNRECSNIFTRMRDRAREMVLRIYDQSQEMSITGRMMNRISIAYNGFWAGHHERRAVAQKNRLDASNLLINNLDQSIAAMRGTIENLQRQGMPGTASIQLQIRTIEERRNNELRNRDIIQTELESREGRMNNYTNRRDRAVDRLVGVYDERLRLMQNELANLQSQRNLMDIEIARAEMGNRDTLARLRTLEEQKAQIAEALALSGMSTRAVRIDSTIRLFDQMIREGNEQIQANRNMWTERKTRINASIAEMDRRSNPHRDNREQLIRIKEGRPLDLDVETRMRGENPDVMADTEVRNRRNAAEAGATANDGAHRGNATQAESRERLRIDDMVSGWNRYLQAEFGDSMTTGENSAVLDLADFLNRSRLSAGDGWDVEGFRTLLQVYYRTTRNRNGRLNEAIERFFQPGQ
ncbi:MAG: hypothetical protein ACD_15C00027G0002 [uncultured bacterium]|nr:MAG: hypothetical protein ACD_15C00027G0002 [uncultured bacterium]